MNVSLLAMFGIGPMEMMIVLGVMLLLFGNRLPGMMHGFGRSITQFKKGLNESTEDLPAGDVR